jgi:nicotinic acid mononucleotide adenylyltransferase
MEFVRRGRPARAVLALFPGAWNPPTRAHEAMAHAALAVAEEVVWVLARAMPHKEMEGASFETRVRWMVWMASRHERFSAALSEGGLFVEMAREARAATGAGRVLVVCGRDAAERIVTWDYGTGEPIERQMEDFELLVAPRGGWYEPPERLAAGVHRLDLPAEFEEVSSTEVRRRMAAGEDWAELVPEGLEPGVG